MNGQRGHLKKLVGRALVGLTATALAAVLLTPTAGASPIGDAEAAMMAAWDKAGGDASTLGARKGDVYPVADGFALDFDGGKMYYTPATGARYIYGPILDKYESLGGPASSDLGFPTINEVPGLAGPDSRVSTFSASDNPVIFWTPDHGAFVVRGALNAAWDKLGSSGGVLGAPVGDETYNGEVASQKFSGGEISWNRKSMEFTSTPPALADQLKDLQVAIDPAAAINMAWRAAGGAAGPLGAKKGDQYPIGGDGIAQDFTGGKVFFSPATGANAVEGAILQKYESLGGPVSSDLGFPIANEADGGITPASRVASFSAADKPVIFWTPDHGAFVVRGAMKAAWDKLKGSTGKLGAPVGDQTVDGEVISQKFTGGKISYNRAKNTFTTDPANLAPLLSGLQVAGQNQPSAAGPPSHGKKFTWHWWWLVAAVPVVLLIVMAVLVVLGLRRRRGGHEPAVYPREHDFDRDVAGYDAGADGHWPHDEIDYGTERFPLDDQHLPQHPAPDDESTSRVSWPRGAVAGVAEHIPGGEAYGGDMLSRSDEGYDFGVVDEEDPDAVDTTPTPIVSPGDLAEATETEEPVVPETVAAETFVPEAFTPETVTPEGVAPEAHVPETHAPESHVPEAAFPDTFTANAAGADETFSDTAVTEAGSVPEVRTGRHAAVDSSADEAEVAAEAGYGGTPKAPPAPTAARAPGQGMRPMIHLPLEHDPYQAPDGYPVKASARFGLYYTPSSALYHDTLAELWFASEEVAQANGFVKAD
ncbi:LGFP repeat-containing protein [Mycobacterium simulans]|uniref:LGFP repeat-containing protein n=1 Tax=Mycobacterium simulans TaxID=627089 RepID=UPI00163F3050|nr:LGFP repeat-containing protein [Mycobacterium simulans]